MSRPLLSLPRTTPSRWLLLAVGVALAAGLLAWLIVAAPGTRIRHVRVDGATGPVEDLARATADQVRGRSAVLTRLGPLEAAIEQDARVADAQVRRSFPDTIIVTVVPRTAVLAAQDSKGQLDLVDIEGVRFATAAEAPKNLPVVRGQGATVVTDAALRVALDVIAAMPAPLRSRMTDVSVTSAESVTFAIDQTSIAWGDASQIEVKARIVSILLSHKPKSIDVSAPNTPVTS